MVFWDFQAEHESFTNSQVLDYGRSELTTDMFGDMMRPLVKGKQLAKGTGGRSKAELEELCRAWESVGIQMTPEEFPDEPQPALALFCKMLMVILFLSHFLIFQ